MNDRQMPAIKQAILRKLHESGKNFWRKVKKKLDKWYFSCFFAFYFSEMKR